MLLNPAHELKSIKSSRSWRYTAIFRIILDSINSIMNAYSNKASDFYNPKDQVKSNTLLTLLTLPSQINNATKRNELLDLLKHNIISKQNFSTIDASIIVPCYNQIEYTIATILSILDCGSKVSFEIIVSDDCSSLDDYKIIEGLSPIIKVVKPYSNLGFLKNCNFAASHAQGKYLVFVNNDCLPLPGWLDSLIDIGESDPTVGIIGSKLLNADGSMQDAGGIIWRDASGWNYGRGQNPLAPEYNYIKEVDYCTGASFCIRKSIWDAIGGFDEHFVPAYYEETDLSFRLREKGYKTVYQPHSVAIHLEGLSNGTDLTNGLKKHQVINRHKFQKRWREVLERDHFVNGSHERFARDRSKDKKHMLFVDHYLPQSDMDAGSKQMLAYLKLFNKSDYQITFWSENQHYNQIYASQLENVGIEVISGRTGWVDFSHWIQVNGKYLNVAFLSRPHIAVNYFNEIRRHSNCRLVYYGHDLHVKRMNLQNALVPGSFAQKIVDDFRGMEESCWEKSDVILYPSIEEVEHLRGKYPHRIIDVLPIQSHPDDEIDEAITSNGFSARNGVLFVGGFTHQPNQDAALWFLNDVFPFMEGKIPNPKITIAGNAPTEEIKSRESNQVVVTGRVSEEELHSLYDEAKVIVAPLRIGAGVKGKVVEALRVGVPIVTTSIGIQGLPGYEAAIVVADDPAEFAKAVQDLLQDESLWQRRRDAGVKYYRENFSESVVAPKVLALLEGAR